MTSGGRRLPVCRRVHEHVACCGVLELQAHHPAAPIGLAVDELGRVRERVVDGDDLSGHWREQVAGGLDRLDDAERLVLGQHPADLGQLDEDEIAELLPPTLTRFLFLRHRPNKAIDFDPSGDTIPRLFDEFDRIAAAVAGKPTRGELPADPAAILRHSLIDADADVALDLQPLIDRCYATGAYDDLDYTRPPEPPLEADLAAWADDLLQQVKLRPRQ